MKILRIISSVKPEKGGPINAAREIDSIINKSNNTIEVLTLDAEFEIDYPAKIHFTGASLLGYGYNSNLENWLTKKANEYDFFVINGLWQYHGFAARKILNRMNLPYIIYTHGMLDPWFKKNFPLKHLKKWLYWPWGEYKILRDAKAVIFTSEEEKIRARESFWLYKANEVVTAYGTADAPKNGHELAKKYLASNPELKNKRIVLFLSRIHEKKGCDLLIEAFASVAKQHQSLHLILAGPDQVGWTKKLQLKARELNIAERISWPGMLKGDDKWGAFYAAEVFCLPSHQENFGIVVAESLACGKPVLISNKVNIWQEIKADTVGFVDEDSREGTLRNLERWLAQRPDEYQAMCERAKESFTLRFHINCAAEHLIEIAEKHMV